MPSPKAKPKQKPAVMYGEAGSKYDVSGKRAKPMSAARARVKQGDNETGKKGLLKNKGT